jgi:hypothetical protein
MTRLARNIADGCGRSREPVQPVLAIHSARSRRASLVAGSLGLILYLASAGHSLSAEYFVTNADDAGEGSLRRAIEDANALPGPDVITFQADLSGSEIGLTSALTITDSVAIYGLGKDNLAVRMNGSDDVFRINSTNAVVVLNSLTVKEGQDGITVRTNDNFVSLTGVRLSGQVSDDGLDISGSGNTVAFTAGIVESSEDNVAVEGNDNTLHISGSEIMLAREDGIEIDGDGNTVRVERTAIHGNGVHPTDPNDGLDIDGDDNDVTLIQVTFSGNGEDGVDVEGRDNSLVASLITVTKNGRDGLHNQDQSGTSDVTVSLSILAGNPGPDVKGDITSDGHNLFGNGNGGADPGPNDLIGTTSAPIDAKLGALDANGSDGLTMWELVAVPSHMPLPGSPAIDAGDNCIAAPRFDQRGPGFPRVLNGLIDIGAVETPTETMAVAPLPCGGLAPN